MGKKTQVTLMTDSLGVDLIYFSSFNCTRVSENMRLFSMSVKSYDRI